MIGPHGEAVFFLNCPDGPPELRECYGFKASEASRIRTSLADRLTMLRNEWSKLHDHY